LKFKLAVDGAARRFRGQCSYRQRVGTPTAVHRKAGRCGERARAAV